MTVTADIQLAGYALEQELGRGDLTTTYLAQRKADGATVAVKIVGPQFTFDRLFVRRFKDITRQAGKLEHPNIVRTYEAIDENDRLGVVRELIEARLLAEVIEHEGPFSPQRMLTVARQLASALDYAHQKSITHGDLSANRIYLGPNDHVTVADFGQTQAMAGTSLVKQGFAVGSPEIIAPERVHGQGATRQSDYYSLGILCYQMLAGAPPFTGSPAAVLHAQAYEQPRPLHIVNPGISVALSETVSRMLAKGLELRYNTGAEFARALAVAIEGTAPIRAPAAALAQMREAGLKPDTPIWRRPWVWLIAAAVSIIALLLIGFWAVALVWESVRPPLAALPQVDTQPAVSPIIAATPVPDSAPAGAVVDVATVVAATALPAPSDTPAAPPTVTPTLAPLPTPGPPVVAEGSPFSNIRLAHAITADNNPEKVGLSFAPGPQPLYLFFDFAGIDPGTPWMHRWRWGDTELGAFDEIWADGYSSFGSAWVFYSPTGGFQPGPYQITLEVNGRTVSTATFVIQAGGL
jgi:serine/threonine-protein kinase